MTDVLVVEDDEMFARAVGDDLRYQGLDVAIVNTVADALDSMRKRKFDVLLTDLRLGAQDGIDLLAALRDVSPQTRAVLMSAFATARDYQRAIELGAVRVLCKPFTPAELIQCIRQAVECGIGFRGSVHGLSLVDMLQMYNYARRSVTIAVEGTSPGRLHLREGQIVHAEHEGRTGEPAVASILAMPAGTLGTTALPARLPQTVTRELREVLLDALRSVDETTDHVRDDGDALDLAFDLAGEDEPPVRKPELPSHTLVLERTREIDGYLAACLFLASNGGVVCFDGSIDLRPAASLTAEAMRRKQKTIDDMGIDDVAEDLLVTSTNQYHLLRRLHSEVPAFIYLVLDRSRANPMLAKLALENAVRSLDRH
ncbi:MAG TPA: response regulator [Polyangiales bacterium]|nr:response regulator [Polyangiales bacterium]